MKILHTSDWHLGQKFLNNDRRSEHQRALRWLRETIEKEAIEVLIVAGDIFDTMNPPNYARRLYYNFLTDLRHTTCRHIVIIGGNHDSPSMLNAPKELLRLLNVHVVGSASPQLEDEIILLKDRNGRVECVVAAVPFLRDKDIRLSFSGESSQERIERIRQGIYQHYKAVGELAKQYEPLNVPILATGHLYASGAKSAEKQDNIYIGNIENINAAEFPAVFDYVALGHIHKAQVVGNENHIRYSGSLIPLGFREANEDKKVVYVLDFDGRQFRTKIRPIAVPITRCLLTVKGNYERVQQELLTLTKQADFTTWVEVIVETETLIPNLVDNLKDLTKYLPIQILTFKIISNYNPLDEQIELQDLDELAPLEVFTKKCESMGRMPEEIEELQLTFKELLNWMEEE